MKKYSLMLTTLFASSLIALSANAMVVDSSEKYIDHGEVGVNGFDSRGYDDQGYNAFGDGTSNHPLSQG